MVDLVNPRIRIVVSMPTSTQSYAYEWENMEVDGIIGALRPVCVDSHEHQPKYKLHILYTKFF